MTAVIFVCSLLMPKKFASLKNGCVKWFDMTTRRVWDPAWSCPIVDRGRPLITGDEGTERSFRD